MPIYMIKYHNDYVLPHAYYESEDAYAKMNECITKEHNKAIWDGKKLTKKNIEENYEIIEVQPDEDLYEYGRDLIIAEIEKNI